MKTLRYTLCLLFLMPMALFAQSNRNLSSYKLGTIKWQSDESFVVKQGEFKVGYTKIVKNKTVYPKRLEYFLILRDKNDAIKQIVVNNFVCFAEDNSKLNVLRAGYTKQDLVYIEENGSDNSWSTKKYFLNVNGMTMGPYDRIAEVLPDGLIYRNRDIYTFKKYDDEISDIKNYCILEKETFKEESIKCLINNKIVEFKPKDNVDYYKSPDGKYYLVYNDSRMDNTLLVVNGLGYELDGSTDNLTLKFSHDGQHWILSCQNYVMVDGVIVVRISGKIKDVDIKNDGQYAYVIRGNGFNDMLYVNDNVFLNGVEVKSLTVDEEQRFNYIVRNKKGYFYGIDNELTSFDRHLHDYYYPELFDRNQSFTVTSLDGKHTLVFNYEKPYVRIDGHRLDCKAIPHYAAWNEKEKCFEWNTVEGLDLMVYKYRIQ